MHGQEQEQQAEVVAEKESVVANQEEVIEAVAPSSLETEGESAPVEHMNEDVALNQVTLAEASAPMPLQDENNSSVPATEVISEEESSAPIIEAQADSQADSQADAPVITNVVEEATDANPVEAKVETKTQVEPDANADVDPATKPEVLVSPDDFFEDEDIFDDIPEDDMEADASEAQEGSEDVDSSSFDDLPEDDIQEDEAALKAAAAKREQEDMEFSKEIQASLDQAFKDRFPEVPTGPVHYSLPKGVGVPEADVLKSDSGADVIKTDHLRPMFGDKDAESAPGSSSIKQANRKNSYRQEAEDNVAPEIASDQDQQKPPVKPVAPAVPEADANQSEQKSEKKVEVEKRVEIEKKPAEQPKDEVQPVEEVKDVVKGDPKPEVEAQPIEAKKVDGHDEPSIIDAEDADAQEDKQAVVTSIEADAESGMSVVEADESALVSPKSPVIGDASNEDDTWSDDWSEDWNDEDLSASEAEDSSTMTIATNNQAWDEGFAAKNLEWGSLAHVAKVDEGVYHLFVNPRAEGTESRFETAGLSDAEALMLKGLQGQNPIEIKVKADQVSVDLQGLDSETKKLALQATLEAALAQAPNKELSFEQLPSSKEDKAILAQALLGVKDELTAFKLGGLPEAKKEFIEALAEATGSSPELAGQLTFRFADPTDQAAFMKQWADVHTAREAEDSIAIATMPTFAPHPPQGEPEQAMPSALSFQQHLPGMTPYIVSAAPGQSATVRQAQDFSQSMPDQEPGTTQYLIRAHAPTMAHGAQDSGVSPFPSGESVNQSLRAFQGAVTSQSGLDKTNVFLSKIEFV